MINFYETSPRYAGRENAQQRRMTAEHVLVFYGPLAAFLGVEELRNVIAPPRKRGRVPFHVTSEATIQHALAIGDEHLNTIQLKLWDACDPYVRGLAKGAFKRAGFDRFTWSLGETVCVLKVVAKHHPALGAHPMPPREWLTHGDHSFYEAPIAKLTSYRAPSMNHDLVGVPL